jgi:hypothetical protein
MNHYFMAFLCWPMGTDLAKRVDPIIGLQE